LLLPFGNFGEEREMEKEIDFFIRSFGTTAAVEAKSDAAKEFARENFVVESWQGNAEHFYTDWRPANELGNRLIAEGWNVVEP
jgi:hypothetical protein